MENTNRISSWRLESNFSKQVSAYFHRAGSLGHLLMMTAFYTTLFLMYWFIWKSA